MVFLQKPLGPYHYFMLLGCKIALGAHSWRKGRICFMGQSPVVLTRNLSVSALEGMEVVHKFSHGNFESLKQAHVLKEPVGYLNTQNKKGSQFLQHCRLGTSLALGAFLNTGYNLQQFSIFTNAEVLFFKLHSSPATSSR